MNIAIVNDSAMAIEAIRRVLADDPRHRVLWTARDGGEAIAQCAAAAPDLILMDMIMPNVDGVEATRQIMQVHPCPILVVTASVQTNCGRVFEAMGAGAIDVVATPCLDDAAGRDALLAKIDLIGQLTSGSPVSRPPRHDSGALAPTVVLLGASAGGPAALAKILGALPRDLPAGVIIVQHVDERFSSELAEWLNSQSALPVRAARKGDRPTAGQALLAARDEHLIFGAGGVLSYTPHPEATPYRPSVDRLFDSALADWTKPLVAVLLTGMGRDGARGLRNLRDAGHFTIAQDETTSALYGMPKAAAQLDAAREILPLNRIAPRIIDKIRSLV